MSNGGHTNVRKPEREETDSSLEAERAKTDAEVVGDETRLEGKAGAVVEAARRRADSVLNAARLRADEKARAGDGGDEADRREQRATEDAALAAERLIADRELAVDRAQRRSAFAAVLRKERETTDRNLVEERVVSDELLAAREAFLGMVNHDLRTLVGGIGLNLALLVKDVVVDDERGRRIVKRIDAIERTTARMNRLIDDLLDIVGIQAGKMSVYPMPHDAIAVVRDALVDLAPSAAAKGIALSTAFTGDALVAQFDHDRVLQVLENLVGNAVKFTPSGGRIIVRVAASDGLVRFAVEDTGPGVADREVPVIFEPFIQGKNLSRHGLGLGLYISKCIVEAHGGKIWLDKTSQDGSVFCFTIPRSAAPAETGAGARANT